MRTNYYNSFENLLSNFALEPYTFALESRRSGSQPKANVRREDDRFVIDIATPGYSKDDFSVKIENDVITVAAQNINKETKDTNKDYYTEFRCNGFERTWSLPDGVKKDSVTANYNAGILTVEIPTGKERERTIKIDVM
jgi:HSP20 family protein